MRFSRRFRRSLSRLVLAGAVVGFAWVPVAAASNVVEKGGQLVPAQISTQKIVVPQTVASPVARYTASGDVVVGTARSVPMPSTGYSRIIGTVHNAPAPTAPSATSSGFDWGLTAIAIASALVASLLVTGVYVLRRRLRLTPA